jgi:hypothetical protein
MRASWSRFRLCNQHAEAPDAHSAGFNCPSEQEKIRLLRNDYRERVNMNNATLRCLAGAVCMIVKRRKNRSQESEARSQNKKLQPAFILFFLFC